MEQAPTRYVELRVESLELLHDYHYGVTLTQQFVAPHHADSSSAASELELLVPLGQFSKERMPDLRVEGPDGMLLPILGRTERSAVGATLFSAKWGRRFFEGIPSAAHTEAREAWDVILKVVAEAINASKREAEIKLYWLERLLRLWDLGRPEISPGPAALLGSEEVWIDLYALAETRLLVATLRGVPGRPYAVTATYTERFHYRGYARNSLSGVVRKGLAWLGLISLPIARSVANVGQAASLWIVQSMPEGVEALRYYWKRDKDDSGTPEPVSTDVARAVAHHYHSPEDEREKDLLLLDVQIAPSTAIVATIGLAGLLLFISTYVYQAIPTLIDPQGDARLILTQVGGTAFVDSPNAPGQPSEPTDDTYRTLLVGLGSIFAAVPAAIAGALAYRGETFVRRVSRGPRFLLAGLSAQAGFLAVVVSLKSLGDLAEGSAYILSVYSVAIIGIFGFIQFGFRWRKNERSRMRSRTERLSPIDCRRSQVRAAITWLVLWTIVVVVFARCQVVLQEDHFFTDEFPDNVWRAWWSWFGLS
jgi:hypothetical protein